MSKGKKKLQPKKKKLSIGDFKKKLTIGTKITLVSFYGQEVNKEREVAYVSSSFVKMKGEDLKDGDFQYLTFPKQSELKETEEGFLILGKYGTMEYKWRDDGSKEDKETKEEDNKENNGESRKI